MSDLMARLRRMSFYEAGPHRWWYKFSHEAADEIENLRARITELERERERLTGELVDSRARETALRSACDSYAKEAQKFHDEARAAEGERDTATRALEDALEVRNWTEAERDGMSAAFERANARHGHYETLFEVGAWLLRHRAALSKTEGKG